jgi:hypothetical protein
VEVWKGEDPGPIGRRLDEAGIEMRIAAAGGPHGGGIPLLSLIFRQKPTSKLLVRESERERARAVLKG